LRWRIASAGETALAPIEEVRVLDKLEYMIALAREKHFGRAAECCGVAQPTFSQGIQHLEELLGVALVKRSSRFLGFTPEGERVLVWARRLVGDAQAMQREIRDMQAGVASHIRMAAMPSTMPILASLTAPFQIENPTVRFTLVTRTSDEIIKHLDDREIDAGIRYVGIEPGSRIEEIPLYREKYLLLVTRDGPFADVAQVAWSQLKGLPLCLFPPNLQHRRIVDSVLRDVGVQAHPTIETDSIPALVGHVRTGKWASVVSSLALDAIDLSGTLRVIPIVEPDVTHLIGLTISKRFSLQPAVATLLRAARARALAD
jgi:DNA-binding transcriptional LysR family regulator